MNNTYEKLLGLPFTADALTDPTERLCSRVMFKIERAEVSRMRRSTLGYGLIVIAAIIAFIPAWNYLSGAFAASGIGQYVSLIAIDGGTAIGYWKELFLSVAESLPVGGISIIVTLLIVSLLSLKKFTSYQQTLSAYEQRLVAEHAF